VGTAGRVAGLVAAQDTALGRSLFRRTKFIFIRFCLELGAQDVCNNPGLGDDTPRREGWVTVEDFAERSDTMAPQLLDEGIKKIRLFSIQIHLQKKALTKGQTSQPHTVGSVAAMKVRALPG
jgi:hypothetical protein